MPGTSLLSKCALGMPIGRNVLGRFLWVKNDAVLVGGVCHLLYHPPCLL